MKYVYRIVNALLALAVLPVLWFVDLLYFEFGISLSDKAAMCESFSAHDIFLIFQGKSDYAFLSKIFQNSSGVFKWPEQFNVINSRLIAMAVLTVLIIICALFIFVFSCISDKRIPILIGAGVGLCAQIAINIVFSGISVQFTSGNIDIISSFTGKGLLASLGDMLLKIDALELGGVQRGEILLFVALILWTVIFFLSELGEKKEK